MLIFYYLFALSHENPSPSFLNGVYDFPYPCLTNDTCTSYEITLGAGSYRLEVWGAKGGDGFFLIARKGGNGGYSSGILTLSKSRKVFVNVGGSGLSESSVSKVNGGFNGGGYNYDSRKDFNASTGGGATDIRLDVNDLYHRIIVAGGGGGSNEATSYGEANGGVGGGINGGISTVRAIYYHYDSITNYKADVSPGTQTEGGKVGISTSIVYENTAPQPNGTFGFGGNIEGDNVMGGPGGGGWYGAAAGNGHGGAGAGGSGFTLNESTVAYTPKSYAFKTKSDAFLMSSFTISGAEKMLSPSYEVVYGNEGHGYARITYLAKHQNPTKNCPVYRNAEKSVNLS